MLDRDRKPEVKESDLLPLLHARMLVPVDDKGRHRAYQTLLNWCVRGLMGGRIKLRHVYRGKHCYTCRQWLEEFFEAFTDAKERARESVEPMPTAREKKQRLRAARKRLADMGVNL